MVLGKSNPTLGDKVDSHADEVKNNPYARAFGYGYLTSGLTTLIIESDGQTFELHMSAMQVETHCRSMKSMSKLARESVTQAD